MSSGRNGEPPAADTGDACGGDLVEVLAEYLRACDRGDVLTAIKAAWDLIDLGWDHLDARLDDADILGFDWEDIGNRFGFDAWHAYYEMGDRCGPPAPSAPGPS